MVAFIYREEQYHKSERNPRYKTVKEFIPASAGERSCFDVPAKAGIFDRISWLTDVTQDKIL